MFADEFTAITQAAKGKAAFLGRNPIGYLVASMLAGIYVGFGILLIFSISGQLAGQPYVKVVMGVSFGIALSLVIMAGSELFTGNNMIMTAGCFEKTVTISQTLKLWLVCYIGNWAGSVLIAAIFAGSGLGVGAVAEAIGATAATKMGVPLWPLFLRGVLCNTLVCLAVWCSFRCKSETAKLIMVFWCLFAFITSGYEHSIANMTLLTASLLIPSEAAVSLNGYFYNLAVVTLGNMAGAIFFLAVPYYLISKKKGA